MEAHRWPSAGFFFAPLIEMPRSARITARRFLGRAQSIDRQVFFDDLQAASPSSPSPKPSAPLLPIAVGLLVGIAADNFLTLPTLGSIALFALGVALFFARKHGDRIGFAALVVAATGLGTLRHAIADRWIAADHVVRFTQDVPILVHLRGELVSAPEIAKPRPDAVTAFEIGPKTRFIIETKTIDGLDGPIAVSGRVAVTVKAPILTLHTGDIVEMTGWLHRPRGPRNPGEYDWALRQRRGGILAAIVCDHGESVRLVAKTASIGWQGFLTNARNRLRGYVLDTAFEEDDPAAGVVAAMVLAQRSAVPRATNEAFIRTGNAHFLAASGMNIAWLAAVGWFVMRLLCMHYRIATLVVAALILSYVLLAEPEPSILRAGIGGLLWCLCVFLRGQTHPLNWLACAAIVLLMIDPMDAFRPGFQYSFLAVLSLLYFCPHVARAFAAFCLRLNLTGLAHGLDRSLYAASLVAPVEPETPNPSNHALTETLRWLAVRLLVLFALSLSAWFVTAPLSCYLFNILNPWGAVCSFLVAFLALPVTCVGYIAMLFGSLFPSSVSFVGPMLNVTTHAMLHLVEFLSTLPAMSIDGRHPSTVWLVAFYAVLGLRIYRPPIENQNGEPHGLVAGLRKHGFKAAAIILLIWWLIPPRWITHDRDALRVWMLAVGDGTGTVIELPNGKVLVYDFGTRSAFDAGPLAVSFLEHRGIDRIDAVFVSHTDFDHYSAIGTLAKQIPIGRIILNDHFERFAPKGSGPRKLLDALRKLNVPIEVWSGPRVLEDTGEVHVESIWPPAAKDRPLIEANETSTVLRLSYEGRSILLTGDVAEAAMGTILAETPKPGNEIDLHADALALPHHGSVVHNTSTFIEAVAPQVAVRSCGQRRSLTTNHIEQIVGGRRYYNTADDGCILLTIRDGNLTAEAVTGTTHTR